MNLTLFNELWKFPVAQDLHEWKKFLEFCESYLKKHKIKNPIVVELGVWRNGQKQFYEQLLGAHHIGIDSSRKKSRPDIQGLTHDPETLKALKVKLGGKPIDILFIDASHWYKDVKKDFEIYSPLCNGIIAFHDIYTGRYQNKSEFREVWKFWDELQADPSKRDYLFSSIEESTGIGTMIRK